MKKEETTEKSSQMEKKNNTAGLFGILVVVLLAVAFINPLAKLAPLFKNSAPTTPTFKSLGEQYKVLGCPDHRYKSVRLLSRRPYIILIEAFLKQEEGEVLLKLACDPIPTFS